MTHVWQRQNCDTSLKQLAWENQIHKSPVDKRKGWVWRKQFKGDSIKYYFHMFNVDGRILVLFCNSLEELGELSSSLWMDWEERNYYKG